MMPIIDAVNVSFRCGHTMGVVVGDSFFPDTNRIKEELDCYECAGFNETEERLRKFNCREE